MDLFGSVVKVSGLLLHGGTQETICILAPKPTWASGKLQLPKLINPSHPSMIQSSEAQSGTPAATSNFVQDAVDVPLQQDT